MAASGSKDWSQEGSAARHQLPTLPGSGPSTKYAGVQSGPFDLGPEIASFFTTSGALMRLELYGDAILHQWGARGVVELIIDAATMGAHQ